MPRHTDFSANIILVCNSLDAGGIERVVSTLANEWSRCGRKVSVITLHDRRRFFALDPSVHHVIIDRAGLTWVAEFLKKLKSRLSKLRVARPWLITLFGLRLYRLFAERFYSLNFQLFIEYESWALRRALRSVESPVVVSFGTSINIITLRACEGLGRRVIISERNDPRRLARFGLWDLMWRKHYRSADLVTANTHTALNDMSGFVEPGKLAYVPNPLALAKGNGNGNGHAHTPISPSPFFLNIGRLVSDKAHDVLLEAFALLGDELKEWRLAILGDGRMRDTLKAQAASLGVASRVHWHGIVQDPHAFYRAANIFVLPSRVEGTPNALLEAMSCGLPVIVSDGAPGPLELVEDGVTGLVVPVNDATALAAALRRLASDDELRSRLGEAARARVSEYELPRALAAWESVVGLTC
jgi:GalNAc-alpha-(1->4)-GalNAc-alpha-(1->3)-diNAcBac-PP-undecaprenol alpha-1,4-N-acetyl-D-galactosaminyltransferase